MNGCRKTDSKTKIIFFVGNSDKVSGSYKNGGIHYNLINMEVWLSWFKAPDLKSDEQ